MTNEEKKYLKHLGKSISEARKAKKMSQLDVCSRIDMDKPYLSSIENGRQNTTALTLRKLAEVIGVSTSDFFKFDNN